MAWDLGLDRYDRKARLLPAVLTVMPIALLIPLWIPEARNLTGTALWALGSAGAAAFLMSWGRTRGRRCQTRLDEKLGGSPSVQVLRHGGPFLAQPARQRVHKLLRNHGLAVPTVANQSADPTSADAAYETCVLWLREKTRTDRLLLEENIEFGFRRNLLGLKAPALAILAACGILNFAAIGLREVVSSGQAATAFSLMALYLAAAAAWVLVIDEGFLEDASWAYARRLIAAAEALHPTRYR